MASERVNATLFERTAAGLGLLTYSPEGEMEGIFKTHFANRWPNFEKFVFACYSDELVGKLLRRWSSCPQCRTSSRTTRS